MLLFPTVEPNYPANSGIDDSVNNLIPFMQTHDTISAGDIIQFAGAVALSNCPVRAIAFAHCTDSNSYCAIRERLSLSSWRAGPTRHLRPSTA